MNLILNLLNKIHQACIDYNLKELNYNQYQYVLSKATMKTNTGNRMANNVAKAFNKCVDVLNAKGYLRYNEEKRLTLDSIKEDIEEMKQSIREAYEAKQKI